MSDRRGKKRPKSYYRKSSHSKRQKLNSLAVGMRGFLVTCNNNEKQAVRESYNILNEYADDLYGPEKLQGEDDESDVSGSEDEQDMEKAMAKEVKAIKEKQKTRRFQNTDTNAKNCIFIRTTLDDPTELHHKIFSDLFEKKVSKARFAMRMLPIAGSCKAVLGEVKRLAEEILPKYFPSESGEERTYSVVFKVRNNNGVSRDSVLPLLGDIVKSLNPLNRVNCDNPDVVILVEIICSVCCLGVSTDFYKFRKYNLHEVVKEDKQTQDIEDIEKKSPSRGAGERNRSSVDGTEDKSKSLLKVSENVDQESKADGVDVTEKSTPSPVTEKSTPCPVTVDHGRTECVEVVDQKSLSVSTEVTPDDKDKHDSDDLCVVVEKA